MNSTRSQADFPTLPPGRPGLSLLEVLIACGVLALGLAGVAAILPAAGQRFGAATVADRARFVAGNAHAEMLNRGWVSATNCAAGSRAVVFGPVTIDAPGIVYVPTLPFTVTPGGSTLRLSGDQSAKFSIGSPVSIQPTTPASGAIVIRTVTATSLSGGNTLVTIDSKIDNITEAGNIVWSSVFVSQDDIAFGQSSQQVQFRWPDGRGVRTEGDRKVFYTGGPTNSFVNNIGPRTYRDSLVWGATLVPASSPASPGGNALLSIFVLRRVGEAKPVTLTRNADGTYQCPEGERIHRLPSCSAVFVVADASGNVRPTWVAVRASWPGGVALDSEAIDPAWQANSLRVIGIDGLVRVEHHLVTLQ